MNITMKVREPLKTHINVIKGGSQSKEVSSSLKIKVHLQYL